MRIVVDMNLSPDWVPILQTEGHEAVHWATVGDASAPDAEIMDWARKSRHIVFTNDLDFGTALALTRGVGPSVIQLRTQDVAPKEIRWLVLDALKGFQEQLHEGALVVVDRNRLRIRLLPLK